MGEKNNRVFRGMFEYHIGMKQICAWCQTIIANSELQEVTHGICLSCLPDVFEVPVVSLTGMSSVELDQLPYGAIVLDKNDVVIAYNEHEENLARLSRKDAIGRNFFYEIAPCTNVQEIALWIAQMRSENRTVTKQMDFVFLFPFGREFVNLSISVEAKYNTTTILVRVLAQDQLN